MGTGDTPDQAAPFDSFYLLSMGDSEIVDTIDIIGLERDAIPIFFTKMEYIANSMTCSPRPQKENRSPHPPLVRSIIYFMLRCGLTIRRHQEGRQDPPEPPFREEVQDLRYRYVVSILFSRPS
jgi:hypothetical protein